MAHHVHPLRPKYRYHSLYPVPHDDIPSDLNIVIVRYLPVVYAKICDLFKQLPVTRLLDVKLKFEDEDFTSVTVDLEDVKAVGVLTILGLGLGIGSILLYRLYQKLISTPKDTPTKDLPSTREEQEEIENEMGNGKPGRVDVYYNSSCGVTFATPTPKTVGRTDSTRKRINQQEARIYCDKNKENVELTCFNENRPNDIGCPVKRKPSTLNIPRPVIHAINVSSDTTSLSSDQYHTFYDTSLMTDDFGDNTSDDLKYPRSPSLLGNYSPASLYDRNSELVESGVFGSASDITTPDAELCCREERRCCREERRCCREELRCSSEPRSNRYKVLTDSCNNSLLRSPYTRHFIKYAHENNVMSRSLPITDDTHHPLPTPDSASPLWNVSDLIADSSDMELLSNSGSLMSVDRLIDFDKLSETGDGETRRSIESSPLRRLSRPVLALRHQRELWGSQESTESSGSLDRLPRGCAVGKSCDEVSDESQSLDIGVTTSRTYETIEHEIKGVNSEFHLLSQKISELCSRECPDVLDENYDVCKKRLDYMGISPRHISDSCSPGEDLRENANSAAVCKELCKAHEIVRRLRGQVSRPPSALSDTSISRSSTTHSFLDLSWDSFDISGAVHGDTLHGDTLHGDSGRHSSFNAHWLNDQYDAKCALPTDHSATGSIQTSMADKDDVFVENSSLGSLQDGLVKCDNLHETCEHMVDKYNMAVKETRSVNIENIATNQSHSIESATSNSALMHRGICNDNSAEYIVIEHICDKLENRNTQDCGNCRKQGHQWQQTCTGTILALSEQCIEHNGTTNSLGEQCMEHNGTTNSLSEQCMEHNGTTNSLSAACTQDYITGPTRWSAAASNTTLSSTTAFFLPNGKKDLRPSIGESTSIDEYCMREWRGTTSKAQTIRNGYMEVLNTTPYTNIRTVRGDNYCAIRATLYQILSQGIFPECFHDKETLLQFVLQYFDDDSHNISSWSFANHPNFQHDDKRGIMEECVNCLLHSVMEIMAMDSGAWHQQTIALFDTELTYLQLFEAIKLLMFVYACDFYMTFKRGGEVPLFVSLMYARDTSPDPAELLRNHINPIGDTAGVEQIEMFLLAHCLTTTLRVYRLSSFGDSDFITTYPDNAPTDWPTVCLIAEDDRHYNVVCV